MLEGELDKIHDFQKAKVRIMTTYPLHTSRSEISHLDRRAIESHQDC